MARPKATPKKITVSLPQQHADELAKLASEAGVSLSSLCAHVLTRYALQDRELMTNDILAERLTNMQEQHLRQFEKRFGDILMRTAHEVVALRRSDRIREAANTTPEDAAELSEQGWKYAVKSLRPYAEKLTPEAVNNGQNEV